MPDVANLISSLNDYGFEDSSTNTKVREIQNTIREIEKLRPWPFLETSIDLTFNGSSEVATNMPTTWRSTLKAKDLVTGRRILPVRLDDFDEMMGVGSDYTKVAAPMVYYTQSASLKFWPIPTASTTVKLRYLQWSAAITSSSPESAILIPSRHHEAIQVGTLFRLYDMEDDPELAVRFESRYRQLITDMIEDVFKTQYDQPDYIHHVDDSDEWIDL